MLKSSNEKQIGLPNRREFLSTMTLAAGALATGLGTNGSAAGLFSSGKSAAGGRVGISEKAYRRAWKRAQVLVARMTLDEKISQLGMAASAIERLKLPGYNYYSGEALHGLTNCAPATSFPVPLALAASWNPDLALRVYTAISDEARAYDNRQKSGLSFYSPLTLNLHRDPRWGRCDEAPGEDPCLASTFGVQVIRGMQGDDSDYLKTTACAKHFICNNTEDDRHSVSAQVDPRSFWEYYTRAYCATVIKGDVFTVMGAYNALNGIPCCASHFLLTELLRDRWGFRGYVTSDCGAIGNICYTHHYAANEILGSALAVSAGCDLNCGWKFPDDLKQAVAQELIGEEVISLAVTRLMTVRCLLGFFESPTKVPYTRIPFSVVDSPAHRDLALEAARQSLVLLKNESHFLPLDKTALKKVVVIGPLADVCHLGGYSGVSSVRISPYAGIVASLGAVERLPWITAEQMTDSEGVRLKSSSATGADLEFISDGSWAEFSKIDFSGKTKLQAQAVRRPVGGSIEVHQDRLDGPLACTLTVPGIKPAAPGELPWPWLKLPKWINVSAPLAGITGEHSIFLKLSGDHGGSVNVQQLQLTPAVPSIDSRSGRPQVIFKPGCTVTGKKNEKMFQEAVDAARDADAVILVCGVDHEVCGEAHDRQTIGLTGAQPELIRAIHAVNPRTVLVLSTNNTVAVPWEQEHLPAILCAVCAGQAQGQAIADVLFGDCNPGGKLPCTWYRSLDQLPPFHDYDLSKGRTYLYFDGDPLYPFGHGLSYTSFQLDQFKTGADSLRQDEKTTVTVRVTNTGRRAGAEVVQLYITPPPSPVKRPRKQLAGFCRVELQPGEHRKVTFELPFTEPAFWYWDESSRRFVLQPGTARILVGDSSANLPFSADLTLNVPAGVQAELKTLDGLSVKLTSLTEVDERPNCKKRNENDYDHTIPNH